MSEERFEAYSERTPPISHPHAPGRQPGWIRPVRVLSLKGSESATDQAFVTVIQPRPAGAPPSAPVRITHTSGRIEVAVGTIGARWINAEEGVGGCTSATVSCRNVVSPLTVRDVTLQHRDRLAITRSGASTSSVRSDRHPQI